MSSVAGSDGRPASPKGLAAILLGITVSLSVLSVFIVGLRIWVRHVSRCFGVEDWLMCIALITNLVQCILVSYGAFLGIGSPDDRLPGRVVPDQVVKIVIAWQAIYIATWSFIKTSLCAVLLRFSSQRRFRYPLIALIVLSIGITLSIIVVVVLQTQCKLPKTAGTGDSRECRDGKLMAMTYVVSVISIIFDWTTTIFSLSILRSARIPVRVKLSINLVFSMGILSSVATIVRLPYIRRYLDTENYLVGLGHIILWSVVESNVGIIAGSLPMLRKLASGSFQESREEAAQGAPRRPMPEETITVGRARSSWEPSHDGYLNFAIEEVGDMHPVSKRDPDKDSGISLAGSVRDTSTVRRNWEAPNVSIGDQDAESAV